MTRNSLTAAALLLSGAVSLVVGSLVGGPRWWAVLILAAVGLALLGAGRALHAAWVRRCVALEEEGRRTPPRTLRALGVAARAHAVAAFEAGFTREAGAVAALERAVVLPWNPGDESEVIADLKRSTREAREALVAGLRALQDEAVEALASPSHPLFLDAHALLELVGHPVPLLFPRLRAESAWRTRRPRLSPAAAEGAIALRLLVAGMPEAALAALEPGGETPFTRRLGVLARFLAVLRRGAAGTLVLRPEEFASWAPELTLLVGRELKDLVPGSPFVTSVPGGAGSLERAVARTDQIVQDLVELHASAPELAAPVRRVLGRLLRQTRGGIDSGLKTRSLRGRADSLLQTHLRGLALLSEGRPREAVAEFQAVLRQLPGLPRAAFSLACAWAALGHVERGEAAVRNAVTARPRDAELRLLLARYLARYGAEDRAREAYESALERFPDTTGIRVAFAQDLMGWDDEKAARQQLETAHDLAPSDPRLAVLAGRARVSGGAPEEAIRPLELACQRLVGAERAEARFWLLAAYREQGRHGNALELADQVLDGLGSGQEELLDELADYLEERHDFLRARKATDRARRLRGGWR